MRARTTTGTKHRARVSDAPGQTPVSRRLCFQRTQKPATDKDQGQHQRGQNAQPSKALPIVATSQQDGDQALTQTGSRDHRPRDQGTAYDETKDIRFPSMFHAMARVSRMRPSNLGLHADGPGSEQGNGQFSMHIAWLLNGKDVGNQVV
jgi:hypothetical protein